MKACFSSFTFASLFLLDYFFLVVCIHLEMYDVVLTHSLFHLAGYDSGLHAAALYTPLPQESLAAQLAPPAGAAVPVGFMAAVPGRHTSPQQQVQRYVPPMPSLVPLPHTQQQQQQQQQMLEHQLQQQQQQQMYAAAQQQRYVSPSVTAAATSATGSPAMDQRLRLSGYTAQDYQRAADSLQWLSSASRRPSSKRSGQSGQGVSGAAATAAAATGALSLRSFPFGSQRCCYCISSFRVSSSFLL